MSNMKTSRAVLAIGAVVACGLVVTASTSPSYAGRFARNHPRRAEVLGRANRLNYRLNRNYGNLDGHFGQLKRQDQMIRRQEQRDARMNGGYITQGQKQQLNREENRLNREIQRDK